ncbi:DinB family protein [Rhodohalobacter sp.]|uniref:DinB family protein n=1 Tax=Rhodohalobacter sp. TaxID=1974210 RepID=UPI00356229A2
MGKSYSYRDIISEYTQALQCIDELTQTSEDLFLLKPDSNTWSANEIFKHLRRFNNLYIRSIDQIQKGSKDITVTNPQFKPSLPAVIIIKIMEPPYKLKIPTLAPMYPKASAETGMQSTTMDLRETNKMAIERLNELKSNAVDIDKLKGRHPVFKFLRMSLTDLFLVMSSHQRRHLWQAEQTLHRLSDNHS